MASHGPVRGETAGVVGVLVAMLGLGCVAWSPGVGALLLFAGGALAWHGHTS
jgi:membrane protein DedA with SNARE-associated domain